MLHAEKHARPEIVDLSEGTRVSFQFHHQEA